MTGPNREDVFLVWFRGFKPVLRFERACASRARLSPFARRSSLVTSHRP